MANERRLIDIAPYENMSCATSCQIYVHRTIGRNCEISMYGTDGIPTVDAVEVVRCRDCKFYQTDHWCTRVALGIVYESDFCSYGEKREVE